MGPTIAMGIVFIVGGMWAFMMSRKQPERRNAWTMVTWLFALVAVASFVSAF